MSTPNREEILNTVKKFILEHLLIDNTTVKLNSSDSFLDKGIIDSTGVMEVISFLQSTFSIEVKDDEMLPENLDSLDNIASYIIAKKAST
jgi:acyl carrier protein